MQALSGIRMTASCQRPLVFIILVAAFGLSAAGCVTEIPPTIAHTHIGHAVTGWHDTPDKGGLLITAEGEAAIGYDHAGFAQEATAAPDQLREHVRHVLHAYAPERTTPGPGLGYGVCNALDGALSHLEFAANSDDATDNVRNSVKEIRANSKILREKCALVPVLAEEIRATDSEVDALILTEELRKITDEVKNGIDVNGNGVVGDNAAEYGIATIHRNLDRMTARERPPYSPVATRWLFSLIRLDDGTWTFRPRAQRDDGRGDGSGGY
jgi:hypothetical protein